MSHPVKPSAAEAECLADFLSGPQRRTVQRREPGPYDPCRCGKLIWYCDETGCDLATKEQK